jgi:glutathione S-transferase
MKLTFSPGSPFARKVRIVAIELGLMDRIELVTTSVQPGSPNLDYTRDVTPLRKLPALILDDGAIILDSYVIAEYLDDLAGGGKLIPASGAARWQVKTEHSLLQGMTDSMLLCRYEYGVRPKELQWTAWYDDHWDRAWQGMARFEKRQDVLSRPLDLTQIALHCVLQYADFRFPNCKWREAFPQLHAFHDRLLQRPSFSSTELPKG